MKEKAVGRFVLAWGNEVKCWNFMQAGFWKILDYGGKEGKSRISP